MRNTQVFLGKQATLLLSGFFIWISVHAQVTFPVNGVADPRTGHYAFTNATIVKDAATTLTSATMVIKDGDAVLVPKGYHPVSAPPGYEVYYLNVMAGPVRTWKFNNSKDHEWIMEEKLALK